LQVSRNLWDLEGFEKVLAVEMDFFLLRSVRETPKSEETREFYRIEMQI